ncbi:MepB protein [compost metagenome]
MEKEGIRVYPPWDTTNSKQAQKTQNWQLAYFLNVPKDGLVDFSRVKALYHL